MPAVLTWSIQVGDVAKVSVYNEEGIIIRILDDSTYELLLKSGEKIISSSFGLHYAGVYVDRFKCSLDGLTPEAFNDLISDVTFWTAVGR